MHQFISRDSKGKIRVAELSADWCDEEHAFGIYKTTYQYGGKRTDQPTTYVRCGKASRTVTEQLNLEYKANMKKYLEEIPRFAMRFHLKKSYENFSYCGMGDRECYSDFKEHSKMSTSSENGCRRNSL